jgi:acetamidase/formamidase/AraC-like DNA-binding protein
MEADAVQSWHFASDDYPSTLRETAWRAAIERAGLSAETGSEELRAHSQHRLSPLGGSFSIVSARSQRFHSLGESDGAMLVVLHLEGKALLQNNQQAQALAVGDFAIFPAGVDFDLVCDGPFRQVWLRLPSIAFSRRMLPPQAFRVLPIAGDSGLGHVLSQLLRSVSDSLQELDDDELSAIEIAISDLIATTLNQRNDGSGTSSSQAAILHRICQFIETRLGDSNLSLAEVARAQRVSPRYLQKLFESANGNFTRYIRERRLERCRIELAKPDDDASSVSSIAFRWGFTDAAHFSRVFRDKYGMSPRDYRLNIRKIESSAAEALHRGRPARASESNISAEAPPVRPDGSVAMEAGSQAHYIPANDKTVHWGYFSQTLPPVAVVNSGDTVTIETLTQHASDDHEKMIVGDPGVESVFRWTKDEKTVDRRGAGPMDASIYGRGAGEGFGVHIMTGPIAVTDAMPGDVVEIGIRDILPRRSAHPDFAGRCFGSNAAAWWGLHYQELITEPKQREVVTIYECMFDVAPPFAKALYSFRWTPQTDPFGRVHATIDYPGVPIDRSTITEVHGILDGVTVPLRPHFGVIGCAPREAGLIDSVPPAYFGGNLDNWRLAKGAKIFLPVSVPGALISVGDPHATQGDSELDGTAIECSLTGVFDIVLHKKERLAGGLLADLAYPLIETENEWILFGFSHPDYLAELGEKAQSAVYRSSSLDLAMKDAFRKVRRFLMATRGLSEDEAISLISVAVDFGVSQVVDGNWAVHAILPKSLFGPG